MAGAKYSPLGTGPAVLIRLSDAANESLISACLRSNRSKTNEAVLRLTDHLKRFPDFYNADSVEEYQEEDS
ncbi:TraY domain-containing protein (plasmid) [Edwardsiella hoshinae]|uniref:TraY domain-containing protein n=1 Tax=Edwardsiella hoshinae TaxID=93378 RepID=UPI000906EB17|nr:TraY domain-containing protein [Edwardsiella hoshinae]QPR26569.1 TraY domain-containing protein [Edwardsiella hoshinae]